MTSLRAQNRKVQTEMKPVCPPSPVCLLKRISRKNLEPLSLFRRFRGHALALHLADRRARCRDSEQDAWGRMLEHVCDRGSYFRLHCLV